MQNKTTAPQTGGATASSVPLIVYQQLAAELQATRAMLESSQLKGQQLTQQNEKLRTEIDRVAQAAAKLQQVANPILASEWSNLDSGLSSAPASQPASAGNRFEPVSSPAPGSDFGFEPLPDLGPVDKLFAEQPAPSPKSAKGGIKIDSNGWWLIVAISLIAAAAFGISFTLVRPMLPQR